MKTEIEAAASYMFRIHLDELDYKKEVRHNQERHNPSMGGRHHDMFHIASGILRGRIRSIQTLAEELGCTSRYYCWFLIIWGALWPSRCVKYRFDFLERDLLLPIYGLMPVTVRSSSTKVMKNLAQCAAPSPIS